MDASETNDKAQLRRGALAVGGGFGIKFGARLSFLLIAAVLYGATSYGAYGIALAVIEVCVTIGGLGMKTMLFQLLEDPERTSPPFARLIDAAIMVTVTSLLLAIIVAGAVLLVPGIGLTGRTLMWMGPMIIGQSLLDLFIAATRWHRLVRYDVLTRSIVEPYVNVLVSAGAYYLGWREYGLVVGYWAGTLVAVAFALSGVLRSYEWAGMAIGRSDIRSLFALVRANGFNVGTDLVTALAERVDLYLVGLLLGEAPAGVYGVARQVCTPMRQVRQSFDSLLTPLVSRDLRRLGPGPVMETISGVSRQMLDLQLPVLLFIAGLGAAALHLLHGNYAAAYLPMLILSVSEILQASFGVADLLFAYRAPARGLAITLGGIVVGIAGSCLFVRTGGMTGIACGLLLGYATRALVRRYMINARFGVLPSLRPLAPLAAGVLAGGAVIVAGKALFISTALVPAFLLTLAAGLVFLLVRTIGGRWATAGP